MRRDFSNKSASTDTRDHISAIAPVVATHASLGYDSRLKGWMFRFRGVATKNLPNYLGWHRYLDVPKTQPTPRKFLTTALDGTST